ncbi:bacterioferritin [Formicincola oecophyllae]|uniref:Bacterioferritin n=1 Tax=Formicincola oecophyllae TaxID=2558361 RepID=A0A4Y6UAT6_9PROT|nr:bacterioferritin [Formicincola oecophyllae]QDH13576.1 bacterioferritin [Formicincola oecophyllae]
MTANASGKVQDRKVIEFLNAQLTNELTVINQFFLHSRTLDHWGVTLLGKKEYEESIEEMRHADWLTKRILFLGGLPNLQRLNPLMIGESVQEILECDLKAEVSACQCLRDGIAYCESVRDYVSRDLMNKILVAEEAHQDFIDSQLDLISRIGIQNYIQLNAGPATEA